MKLLIDERDLRCTILEGVRSLLGEFQITEVDGNMDRYAKTIADAVAVCGDFIDTPGRPKTKGMSKIECYSNWCWIDRLDGVDLENGELLCVRFADGHEATVECVVERKTIPINDHGHNFDALSSQAFAEIYYHGVPVKMPLIGLEARRLGARRT